MGPSRCVKKVPDQATTWVEVVLLTISAVCFLGALIVWVAAITQIAVSTVNTWLIYFGLSGR